MTDPTLFTDHWRGPSGFRDGFKAPPIRAPSHVPEDLRPRWERIAARVWGEEPGLSYADMEKRADEGLCEEVDEAGKLLVLTYLAHQHSRERHDG